MSVKLFALLTVVTLVTVTQCQGDIQDDVFDEESVELSDLEDELGDLGAPEAVSYIWWECEGECENGGKKTEWGTCDCADGFTGKCCTDMDDNEEEEEAEEEEDEGEQTDGIEQEDEQETDDGDTDTGEEEADAEEDDDDVDDDDITERDLELAERGWRSCTRCYHGGTLKDSRCTCTNDYWGRCCLWRKHWRGECSTDCKNGGTKTSEGRCDCPALYTGRCCGWRKLWKVKYGENGDEEAVEEAVEEGIEEDVVQKEHEEAGNSRIGRWWCSADCQNGGRKTASGRCACTGEFWGRCCTHKYWRRKRQ